MKYALALLFALVASLSLNAQVFITSFGSDDFTDYSSPALTSTGQYEGDVSTAYIGGDFASVDITGYTTSLALTATVTENPATEFQIWLYDNVDNIYVYEGNWSDFTTGVESTAILTAIPDQTDPFDFTQVQGLDFYFNSGVGSKTINVTLNTLTATSAVPEPATCAALLGLVALGCGLLRRRRR